MITKSIKIYQDGACNNKLDRPAMGLGIAVFIDNEYQEDLSRAIYVDPGVREEKLTSNVAEWLACVEAMKIAHSLKDEGYIQIFSDSQVISSQFNGDFTINKEEFKEYYKIAKHYGNKAGISQIKWIPRELNTKADELSKIGLHGEDYSPKRKNK